MQKYIGSNHLGYVYSSGYQTYNHQVCVIFCPGQMYVTGAIFRPHGSY